ncbi:MAG: carbohydrate porin [Sulfuritalea sp.]|nr:carbohydrate porin [Sulfuritalea sp.]MDP1982302.1 carbohydrate porin [Sulfuritalea sp.]
MRNARLDAAACALFAGLALPATAADESAPDYVATTLSGDWGSARSELWQRGVALEAGLKFDSLRNRGGAIDGGHTLSHLEVKLRADLEKLLGWSNTVAFINSDTDAGSGINARHTGSLMGVSNIEVPIATTRLYHAWLQKGFFDNRVSLLAGIYPIDSEFFTMDSAATLLHPAFGTPADLALTDAPSVFNNAAFGVRAKWQSADRERYAMAALMDGIPNDPARPKATAVRFAKGDGAFVIGEIGWLPLETGHGFEAIDPARVPQSPESAAHEKYGGLSKYAIGFWRYGNRVPDQLDVDADGKPLQRRAQGAYVLAERSLFSLGGDAGRDVTAFGRYSFSDGNAIAIDRTWNLGLRIRGPLAKRPDDSLTLGWTRSRLAPKWRAVQAAAGIDTAPAEEAFEITWRAALTPWLALQPNLQHVRHPGGTATARNATLLGARIEITF